MAYTPDPTNPAKPSDATSQGYAGVELRVLKQYLQDLKQALETADAAETQARIDAISAEISARETAVQQNTNAITTVATYIDDTVTPHIEDTANPHGTNKTHVGLGNVDNTADANKPVSTPQQTALDTKTDKSTFDSFKSEVDSALEISGNDVNVSGDLYVGGTDAALVGMKVGYPVTAGNTQLGYPSRTAGTVSATGATKQVHDGQNYPFLDWQCDCFGTVRVYMTFHSGSKNVIVKILRNGSQVYYRRGEGTFTHAEDISVSIGDTIQLMGTDDAGNDIFYNYTFALRVGSIGQLTIAG